MGSNRLEAIGQSAEAEVYSTVNRLQSANSNQLIGKEFNQLRSAQAEAIGQSTEGSQGPVPNVQSPRSGPQGPVPELRYRSGEARDPMAGKAPHGPHGG